MRRKLVCLLGHHHDRGGVRPVDQSFCPHWHDDRSARRTHVDAASERIGAHYRRLLLWGNRQLLRRVRQRGSLHAAVTCGHNDTTSCPFEFGSDTFSGEYVGQDFYRHAAIERSRGPRECALHRGYAQREVYCSGSWGRPRDQFSESTPPHRAVHQLSSRQIDAISTKPQLHLALLTKNLRKD